MIKKVEEKIPSDMATAYRRNQDTRLNHHKDYASEIDFEKAEYKEITPEEALAMKKAGTLPSLRIMYKGDYATYREDGYCDKSLQANWKDRYETKSGKKIYEFRDMPISHVLKIADKIYVTNEDSPEAKIDDEKLKRREMSNEFRHTAPDSYYSWYGNTVYANGKDRTGFHGTKSYAQRYYPDRIKDYQTAIDNAKEKYEAGDMSRNEYERIVSSNRERIIEYEREIADERRSHRDAIRRDSYVTAASKSNVNKYKALKQSIDSYQRSISHLTNKIDDISSKGKDANQYSWERKHLDELRRQLSSIKREIKRYEDKLSDDATAKEVEKATSDLEKSTADLANVKAELNKLLKREGVSRIREQMLVESFNDELFNKVWNKLETMDSKDIYQLMSNWFGNLEGDEELVAFAVEELGKLDNESLEDALTSVRGETVAHFFVNWYGRGEFGSEEFARYMEDEGYELN